MTSCLRTFIRSTCNQTAKMEKRPLGCDVKTKCKQRAHAFSRAKRQTHVLGRTKREGLFYTPSDISKQTNKELKEEILGRHALSHQLFITHPWNQERLIYTARFFMFNPLLEMYIYIECIPIIPNIISVWT